MVAQVTRMPMRRELTPVEKALDEIGCTYRQLDYWCRAGYLNPPERHPGSGHVRDWPYTEIRVAKGILRLQAAGLPLALAARAARAAVETGETSIELAEGVWLDLGLEAS